MLKALELQGFKSFADRTRFEFPAGITVIVGPNGSGKSNIVDSMKWVLGEQSAKSLRGREMADVIFKGSGTSGRKPMNTAEATLVFDNSEHRLGIDAPEVHVTRRVYRSGEGEYLINRQPCRLRDIKDLFRGTGVGADAYSLIEQGKVDSLLQATARDRRAIFEEAAGISRFKAKKIESQRRLERVAQNLLRLNDIVEEVESRLRSVRSQAAKARRYKELSERLQQLRTQVGLTDWRALTGKLTALEAELTTEREEIQRVSQRSEELHQQSRQLEHDAASVETRWQEVGDRSALVRERLATGATAAAHERDRSAELEQQIHHASEQLLALNSRAGDSRARLEKIVSLLRSAEDEHGGHNAHSTACETKLTAIVREHEEGRSTTESLRSLSMQQMRTVAALANQLATAKSQHEDAAGFASRLENRLAEIFGHVETHRTLAESRREKARGAEGEVARLSAESDAAEQRLVKLRSDAEHRRSELESLRARLQAARDRSELLAELERTQAGLAPGARELIERSRRTDAGPFAKVRGIVADLIEAKMELAPLVDAALGEAAQWIVVEGSELGDVLPTQSSDLPGRVGVVRCDGPATGESTVHRPQLQGVSGVIGRADRLVSFAPTFERLVRQLLGQTWFVETLQGARSLQGGLGRNCRFVTRSGDVLEADGTLITGPRRADAGLVARRSELRAITEQTGEMSAHVERSEAALAACLSELAQQETLVRQTNAARHQWATDLVQFRTEAQAADERCRQLQEEHLMLQGEHEAARTRHAAMGQNVSHVSDALATSEMLLAGHESELKAAEARLTSLHEQRREHEREATAAQVRLAKSEQRLEGIRQQVRQFEDDQEERAKALAEVERELQQCRERAAQAALVILNWTSELAHLFGAKEFLAKESQRLAGERETIAGKRTAAVAELEQLRKQLRQREERQHQLELSAGEVRHERTTLADRLREDYGIDLAAMDGSDAAGELARQEVETEIAELRRRLHQMGAVNLEALEELEALEGRFGALNTQYQDLVKAKESLERIIDKINTDSRRLFTETLEAIRTNFQQLFRRVFGGGKADIVLEEGVDMLEAGVEIIATPPGKQSLSISLLSGGEKALTAVTLLMAIFQFRPSPFCVLDEVDGPLDEANIGRFIEVLKEFLSWTKFVIVTHSKKTMTAATTLYGVTMQESGISKRVSVRFEDVSNDGAISRTALEREEKGSTGATDSQRGVA